MIIIRNNYLKLFCSQEECEYYHINHDKAAAHLKILVQLFIIFLHFQLRYVEDWRWWWCALNNFLDYNVCLRCRK